MKTSLFIYNGEQISNRLNDIIPNSQLLAKHKSAFNTLKINLGVFYITIFGKRFLKMLECKIAKRPLMTGHIPKAVAVMRYDYMQCAT